MKKNEAHLLLEQHMAELGICWRPEVRFAPPRRWRFDYLLDKGFGGNPFVIEIDGGLWVKGQRSHVGGTGKQNDIDKRNEATAMGYRVLVFSTKDVLTGRARDFLKKHLESR